MNSKELVRFWDKFEHDPSGCWIWTACKNRGYGQFMLHRKKQRAHRVSYEHFKGSIPGGLHIDHLCRNRACVNPKHLEAVSQAENNRRQGASQTHCIHGHEFTFENTYVKKHGYRECRTCIRDRGSKRYR